MSARFTLWTACRALALRTRPPAAPRLELHRLPRAAARRYTDDANNTPPPKGKTAPPRTHGQTPQEEVEETDAAPPPQQESQDSSFIDALDDSVLEQMMYGGGSAVPRFTKDGLTPAQEETLYREGRIPSAEEAEIQEAAAEEAAAEEAATEDIAQEATDPGAEEEHLEPDMPNSELYMHEELLSQRSNQEPEAQDTSPKTPGHKFPLPAKPFPDGFHLKKRYHPVLEQITRLLMRDGKLSVAQRNMAMVLNHLRTSPAPRYDPEIPLLPGSPPSYHLPLNPILYLTLALDSVAPLVRNRSYSGAAGGGRALDVPTPLGLRQRRRIAFQWILDVVNKRPSRGSGRRQFPQRVAEEIMAIIEGRSGAWEKRRQMHKASTTARANILVRLKK